MDVWLEEVDDVRQSGHGWGKLAVLAWLSICKRVRYMCVNCRLQK